MPESILPAVIFVAPLREKHLGVIPQWAVTFGVVTLGGDSGVEVRAEQRRQPVIRGEDERARRLAAYRAHYPKARIQVLEEPIGSEDELGG